ncbi:hypothetical protein D3C80_2140840 [compost metagenome]
MLVKVEIIGTACIKLLLIIAPARIDGLIIQVKQIISRPDVPEAEIAPVLYKILLPHQLAHRLAHSSHVSTAYCISGRG